ncbi:MAG: tRNA uracil 4-sulfurtransferase ThiI [Candidatus Uhrbacteria bacterium]
MFERQLVENIRRALRDTAGVEVRRMSGRIVVRMKAGTISTFSPSCPSRARDLASLEEGESKRGWVVGISDRLAKVFGVANFLFGYEIRSDRDGLAEDVVENVKCQISNISAKGGSASGGKCQSFAVRVKRGNKSYPETSIELERRIGAAIQAAVNLRVDLERPDFTVHIEIVEDEVFVLFEKQNGPGGLPVGVSGRAVALLSGGFDSPVAAWRIMKRGCSLDFVHFHSYPYTSDASIHNVEEIARRLAVWQGGVVMLHLVPFVEFQKAIVVGAPSQMRVILYRRMMMRVAEAIACQCGVEALITGESLGQVASQTLSNIATIGAVVKLPVLRPLIGDDKQEIITRAEAIGTAEISARPADDCCSLFMPTDPVTRTTAALLEAVEESLDVARWLGVLRESTETRQILD